LVILLEPATVALRLKCGAEVRSPELIAELRRAGVRHFEATGHDTADTKAKRENEGVRS